MGTKHRITLAGTAARPKAEAQVPPAATTAPGNAPAVEQGAPVAAQRWKGWLVLSDAATS
jgi:hypothetical protein